MHAPMASGIHGISNAWEWIYAGDTEGLQGARLAHLQDFNASLISRQPKGFVFEVYNATRRSARQDRLAIEYAPTCSRHSSRSS